MSSNNISNFLKSSKQKNTRKSRYEEILNESDQECSEQLFDHNDHEYEILDKYDKQQ